MKKIVTIILLIFSTAFPIKAIEADMPDSLEISYDHVYAVDWTVNVYSVADVFTFPQDSIDIVWKLLTLRKKRFWQMEIGYYGIILIHHSMKR